MQFLQKYAFILVKQYGLVPGHYVSTNMFTCMDSSCLLVSSNPFNILCLIFSLTFGRLLLHRLTYKFLGNRFFRVQQGSIQQTNLIKVACRRALSQGLSCSLSTRLIFRLIACTTLLMAQFCIVQITISVLLSPRLSHLFTYFSSNPTLPFSCYLNYSRPEVVLCRKRLELFDDSSWLRMLICRSGCPLCSTRIEPSAL